MSDSDFLLNQLSHEDDALSYAVAMQHKASSVGFDWPDIKGVIGKIHEELDELGDEIDADADKQRLADELGDVLFACCNLARHLGIDPVEALSGTNQKFYRRFNFVETSVSAAGKTFSDFTLDELDQFWDQAKQLERLEDNDIEAD
ncbi:MazG nucleotide pyrophosphohydrolase domain-containing protein [uncultured Methylophaga sp.]|uniref:MazG nucleotide pyrophosphohydrolase domain-containing protein n=1 Tax=uncultured Methylophaga sp. TaxID=285271 RepID=UPI002606F6CE|nr:MazG nucleotide pyrophosphohydrolase domain-containing protein [uncultured Methylophaga sp.]